MDKSAWPFAQLVLTDDELKRMKEEIRLHPPMAITVSSGEITQITPIYQDRAIDILREIVEANPVDPERDECWFCKKENSYILNTLNSHADDCSYILAQQLLNEIDNYGRTQTEIP